MQENINKFIKILTESAENLSLRLITLHSPSDKTSERLKIKGTLREIGGKRVLQLESFLTEGRVTHENVALSEISEYILPLFAEFRKADLVSVNGSASLMVNKKGDKASVVVHGTPIKASGDAATVSVGNNVKKKHILDGGEVFLRELGVSDANGRVKDKMQAKFRQINRFCEYISEAIIRLGDTDEVKIADLCCGKSYLSFAAYHTVTHHFGKKCTMYCVDLKKSVIDYCADIAERCSYHGMKFFVMDINDFTPECPPDIVISLHACDVATDIVLESAIRTGAKAILSTPCCHHELSEKFNSPSLDFIAKRPLLKQKLCAAATDALRLMRLEAAGYEVDATELIDPENTPKNVMLRGYLKKRQNREKNAALFNEYAASYRFMYGIDPAPLP